MTTLSQLNPIPEQPVFAEPWEAQAFALAVRLSEQGHFTWKEWAAELAAELMFDEPLDEPLEPPPQPASANTIPASAQ